MNPGIMAVSLPFYGSQIYNAHGGSVDQQEPENVPDATTAEYSGPLSGRVIGGEPAAVWVGMLALLFVIGWYGRQADTLGGEVPRDLRIGLYNWLSLGIMAATFFVLGKVIFTKFPVPGVSSFLRAL